MRYSDLPISEAWMCDKSKKISDDPLAEDGVPGYGNNPREMTISLPKEQLQKVEFRFLDLNLVQI